LTEERHLQTIDRQGATAPITLRIDADAGSTVRITARTATDTIGSATGADLLESLTEVRRQLEAHGLRLCCQGARLTSSPRLKAGDSRG
jgi:hypothetical protein